MDRGYHRHLDFSEKTRPTYIRTLKNSNVCGNDLCMKYAAVAWNNGENEQNQKKGIIGTKEKS